MSELRRGWLHVSAGGDERFAPMTVADAVLVSDGGAATVSAAIAAADTAIAAADTAIAAHTANTSNPHGVTAEQVGVGKLLWSGELTMGGTAQLGAGWSEYTIYAVRFAGIVSLVQMIGSGTRTGMVSTLTRNTSNLNMQTIHATLTLTATGVLSISAGYMLSHTSAGDHGTQTTSTTRSITHVWGLA